MGEPRKKVPFGFLICGLVIGLSLGVVGAKRMHNVGLLIIGPILGVVAGAFLEAWARRHGQINPPTQTPDDHQDSE